MYGKLKQQLSSMGRSDNLDEKRVYGEGGRLCG